MTRMFWSKEPTTTREKNNLIHTFESAIYEDEAHTIPFNIQGMQVKAIIRSDDYFMQFEIIVTNKINENFEFMILPNVMPEIGKWKIEFFITQGTTEIGMTHHDDFDVEE